ncbi:MAG: N-acetylmuramoyl-L-alanine amidase [Puniceicoccales bacterium]|jgi:N-acetylmuramoyl-L-alanine amidase|nr:N-acetylmuramoyl-L-alanine amidase [Puniceicoccales bacterium]
MGTRVVKFLIHAFLCTCVIFFPRSSGCAHGIALDRIAADGNLKMLSARSFGGNGIEFLFVENSRIFTFNGIRMPLGFAVTKKGGKFFVEQSDYRCHILPLLRPKFNGGGLRTIAIDAGHGGADEGTVSKHGELREKVLTLDICHRLAKLLQAAGYRVVLTRSADMKIPLFERSRIANSASADLFVSIHCNSAPSPDASGIEVFLLTPMEQASSYQPPRQALAERVAGNGFDAINIVLGYCLQSAAVSGASAVDRGVKHDRFAVLRGLNCPGALVECGFLSNPRECKKLASAAYRDRLARALFDGIVKFDGKLCGRVRSTK